MIDGTFSSWCLNEPASAISPWWPGIKGWRYLQEGIHGINYLRVSNSAGTICQDSGDVRLIIVGGKEQGLECETSVSSPVVQDVRDVT